MMEQSNPRFLIARTTPETTKYIIPATLSSEPDFMDSGRNPTATVKNHQIGMPSPPPNLAEEYKKLKRSAAPSRFLFFRDGDGSWVDFPPLVFAALRDGFVSGRTFIEVYFAGILYLFDFLRMSQLNSVTGASNSIGWIDVKGRCFFPTNRPHPRMENEVRLDGDLSPASSSTDGSDEKTKGQVEDRREQSGESPSVSSTDGARWPGVELLSRDDKYYKVIEKLFLSGVRRFAPNTIITSIRKCSYSGSIGSWRRRTFEMQIQMTKAARGNANVKFGWYGTSAGELPAIVAHGFGRPNNQLLGPDAYGVGVHISSPFCSYSSSLLSESDGNGEKLIVLCRVIMGRPEKVEAGSDQYHPSSDEFDSGVDDLTNPKWYIVWSTHMNAHIIPEYIVSFKTSKQQPQAQGPRKLTSHAARPYAPGLSFSKLLAELGRLLPSSAMQSVNVVYNQYTARKISKESFIRYLRRLVGDKLLVSAVKKLGGF